MKAIQVNGKTFNVPTTFAELAKIAKETCGATVSKASVKKAAKQADVEENLLATLLREIAVFVEYDKRCELPARIKAWENLPASERGNGKGQKRKPKSCYGLHYSQLGERLAVHGVTFNPKPPKGTDCNADDWGNEDSEYVLDRMLRACRDNGLLTGPTFGAWKFGLHTSRSSVDPDFGSLDTGTDLFTL
jgi:hypothetical protein